jgi:kynurenine formamidase
VKLVDLTRPLDPEDIHKFPENRRQGAATMVPEIEYHHPAHEGADQVCAAFGCARDDLPDGEGWGSERLHINTHLGTHVDAPLHYGSMCEGQPARTITDISVDELFVDALVLDLRGMVRPNEGIEIEALKTAIANNGAPITPGCALLLRTGQERYSLGDKEYFQYPGMTRSGTLFLANTGAKILGTDALGWDRPFHIIRRAFRDTKDRSTIWDGHYAGREKEVFIVQQMHNLASVPASGFKVGCFPLPLARCSASPARVVAFVPEAAGAGIV